MLLGLPGAVWAVLGIEFVERLGYYAVAFSLFTYCTVMLKTGPSAANAIINIIYVLIPAAAFFASGLADSSVGRPRVLAVALALYTFSLVMLFISACPGLYGDFPKNPLVASKLLLAVSLICFSAGYGSMKVCTNPIMADCVVLQYRGTLADVEGEEGNEDESNRHAQEEHMDATTRGSAITTCRNNSGDNHSNGDDDCGEHPSALVQSSDAINEALKGEAHNKSNSHVSFAYRPIQSDTATTTTALTSESSHVGSPRLLPTTFDVQLERQTLSRLFIYAYWIANVGGLVGSFVAPLLRNWDSRRVEVGSKLSHSTGYYYSFLLAALSVGLGGVFLYTCYHWLPRNAPAPSYVLVRVLMAAAVNRWSLARGTKTLADPNAPPPRDWFDYASVVLQSTTKTEVSIEGEWRADIASGTEATTKPLKTTAISNSGTSSPFPSSATPLFSGDSVTTAGWVADCRATLRVCKAFIALPIYWLLCNQFSTNLMYQAIALSLPDSVPEELFNNINTLTMLVFLALWDQWILPHVLQHRVPPACLRIVGGFTCMCGSMVWCGFLQCAITKRGHYVGEDSYVLHEGRQRLSARWLVVPYVLQGFSSAFVDPTVMEVAYRDAPARMKGTVMGLYWMASSASGFLGLALSPVMKPQNATVLFFVFAAAQMVVSSVFYVVNCGHSH